MNRNLSGLALPLAAAALLVSCSKVTAAGSATHYLRIADGGGDVPTLNPHLSTQATVQDISQMTQAYLVRYDAKNRPYPELVTAVPTQANGGISKDGKTITWHLRRGVRWSDGVAFDADDVVFTTRVVLNPANNEVGRDGWNLITKVGEPDKYTVVYHLKRPYSPYLPTFFGSAGANPSVLPKHLLASNPTINNVPYNAKPVGIGPFRVVDWKRGDAVDLEANPYYFRGAPKLKRVTYKFIPSFDTLVTLMQTGDVDLWADVPPPYILRMKAITRVRTDVVPGTWFAHLDFNVSRPLVSDVRVREAIRYALDRRQIVEKVVHGFGTVQESSISPVLPFAPKGIPFEEHDSVKAKQLLDAAGWKPGPDGVRMRNGRRLSLQFPYFTGSSTADEIVELIRQELSAVGVDLQTRKYAPAIFFAPYQDNGIIYRGKWDVTAFIWQDAPNADLSNLYECNQIPPAGQNTLHYCNHQLDGLLEKQKGTYDERKKAQLLDREMRTIVHDVPTIVLCILDDGYSYNPKVTGFHPGTFTSFDQMGIADI